MFVSRPPKFVSPPTGIRKLQAVLLKVALLVGVEVHFNVSFEELIEPTDTTGWRARLLPENHVLASQDFDVVIGADGRRNTLPGFKRKEFRGKLAIGITANFVNYFSNEEQEVQERSGVAFIFDQKFFLDLRHDTGIDLENIVYYKDDTHYFVMTAKKQSLIDKGVIKKVRVRMLAKNRNYLFLFEKKLFHRITQTLIYFCLKKMSILTVYASTRKKRLCGQQTRSCGD